MTTEGSILEKEDGGNAGATVSTYPTVVEFPPTGTEGGLYVAEDTDTIYYWDGASYVAVGSGTGLGNSRAIWGYQDFDAGEIDDTSFNITANENGTSAPFSAADIINSSAAIFREDGQSYAYTGSIKLFSSKVQVNANSYVDPNATVTLSGIPHASWGTLRVWYQITATAYPESYTNPPLTVQSKVVTELGAVFEEEEKKDASGGYVGLTLFKINFKNVANTFTSFFTNSNTAARTYTFQDRDGIVADDADITAAEARSNHTGTQTASTISDFSSAAKTAAVADAINNGTTDVAPSQNAVFDALALKEDASAKGAANGYAPLGSDSKISSTYLPSYVDDVIEAANFAALPVTGETGKIYVTIDTGYQYRWSGSIYVEIKDSGETVSSAGALINSATDKATPVDADYIGIMDSAASNILKKLSWANIKATLKTYFDGLYAIVAEINVFAKSQRSDYTELTDASTISIDLSYQNLKVTLGGNRTLGVPTNVVDKYQTGTIDVMQDATGSRTLSFEWCYEFSYGFAPVLQTTKYRRDILAYKVNYYKTGTFTVTIASPGVFTKVAHGFKSGNISKLATTGALPTGLAANTKYWIHAIDADTFHLSTSLTNLEAGTYINTSGSQSGTHTITALSVTVSHLPNIFSS